MTNLEYQIKMLLEKNVVDESDLIKVYKDLEKIRDKSFSNYNLIKMELLLNQGKYSDVKTNIDELEMKDDSDLLAQQMYYHYHVRTHDFNKALFHLIELKLLAQDKNLDTTGLDLQLGMLQYLYNIRNYPFLEASKTNRVQKCNRFMFDTIENKQTIGEIYVLINLFNKKDFERMEAVLRQFTNDVTTYPILTEFNSLKVISEKIVQERNLSLFHEKEKIMKEKDNKKIFSILQDINLYTKFDFKAAIELIDCIKKSDLDDKNIFALSCLKNKIKEKKKRGSSRFIKNYETISNMRKVASMQMGEKNYKQSYLYYSILYKLTRDPMYFYYMGKSLYKIKMYDDAFELLKKYEKIGGTKVNKTYTYLAVISLKKDDEDSYQEYVKKSNIVNKLFGNSYLFKGYGQVRNKKKIKSKGE